MLKRARLLEILRPTAASATKAQSQFGDSRFVGCVLRLLTVKCVPITETSPCLKASGSEVPASLDIFDSSEIMGLFNTMLV